MNEKSMTPKGWKFVPAEATDEMIEAGREIASNLVNAQVSHSMNGLGGSKTWSEWLDDDVPNRDLVIAYMNNEIDSITAIYKAMLAAAPTAGQAAAKEPL